MPAAANDESGDGLADRASPLRIPIAPENLPLDPDFAARPGPAVPAERLTPQALRQRFQNPPRWQAENRGDHHSPAPGRIPRAAAVLIGLIERGADLHVLFTLRSAHLSDHAGQVSFPGGRKDATDGDAVDTALRESREEIGLAPERVEILGTLPEYLTGSGYRVTPVVGLVGRGEPLRADPLEVDEIFDVPLAYLMNGAHHQRRIVLREATPRFVYAIDYRGPRPYLIWGVTAAMLRNLYGFLLA